MSVLFVFSSGSGATVTFRGDCCKKADETELYLRVENMLKTAEQAARENELRRLRAEKTDES